jgi:Leucine-rich repeat (LRR) protein
VFNSVSLLEGFDGHLPLEIGNLTELIELNFQKSDLSAGPVPESIGLCTKLVKVRLSSCKLNGEFPTGLQTLNSLGMSILAHKKEWQYSRLDRTPEPTQNP